MSNNISRVNDTKSKNKNYKFKRIEIKNCSSKWQRRNMFVIWKNVIRVEILEKFQFQMQIIRSLLSNQLMAVVLFFLSLYFAQVKSKILNISGRGIKLNSRWGDTQKISMPSSNQLSYHFAFFVLTIFIIIININSE